MQTEQLLLALDRCRAHPDSTSTGVGALHSSVAGDLVLITGVSGTGKTSLAEEVFAEHIVSGKFDLIERHEHYYPIVQALTELAHKIVDDTTRFGGWCTGAWSWDSTLRGSIAQRVLGDGQSNDATRLIVGKIQRLDKMVQDVLMVASCRGAEFDEYLLHGILTFDVGAPLSSAEDKGLVVRERDGEATWRFVHDQIQQSAYDLIPRDERESVHLQIGRKLWARLPPDQLALHTFLVVNQLRLGVGLMSEQCEREQMAALLLRAGEKAAASSAFLSASDYLRMGIDLLDRRGRWRDQYELSLDLFSAAAEVEYCNGHFERMDELISDVLRYARCQSDKSRGLTASIYSLGSRNELQKAIDLGFHVLNNLGVNFPSRPSAILIMYELVKTKRALRRVRTGSIVDLPQMNDPTRLSAMRIMNLLFTYSLTGRPMYAPLISMRLVQMSLAHGVSCMSCAGFSSFALLLCNAFSDISGGIEMGRVALSLLDRFQAKEWLARVHLSVYGFCLPF